MSKYRLKGGGTPEVHSARSKLDGVLQTLVERKDESFVSDEEGKLGDNLDSSPDFPVTPTKRSGPGRPQKKRKRGKEDPNQDTGEYMHTYVMKLFDRSVDLAQFGDNSSLYPICRAWIRNQPHNKNLAPRERTPTPEPQLPDDIEEEDNPLVYSLPPPLPLPKSETNQYVDPRIPLSLKRPQVATDFPVNPERGPAPEELLLNHLQNWKRIRSKWRDAARLNEDRYHDSMSILKAMYERQCKDQ